MKRILILFGLTVLFACKPEVYLGPLDSPVGNWRSAESIYYFNGETVYQNNSCEYSAISFYKDSLCCIEGRKGTFKYYMSEVEDSLVVDSVAWHIEELTGKFLKLDYLEDLRWKDRVAEDGTSESLENDLSGGAGSGTESAPDESSKGDSEKGPIVLPVQYEGVSIVSDGNGSYMYSDLEGKDVPCRYISHTDENGNLVIDCWFDSRHDTYKPF